MTQYQQVFYECETCGHRRYSLDTISFSYFPNDSQKAQDATQAHSGLSQFMGMNNV